MTNGFASQKPEQELLNLTSSQTIAGIDEVGRGAIAGPLVTCCFVRTHDTILPDVKDSKLLSPKKRRQLSIELVECAAAWSLGIVSAQEINDRGMSWAVRESFNRAVGRLPFIPEILIYDGQHQQLNHHHAKHIINGDETHSTIAAASIIAKVIRDFFMMELHEAHPTYGFAQHKGYGTRMHSEAILKHGQLATIHRTAFIH